MSTTLSISEFTDTTGMKPAAARDLLRRSTLTNVGEKGSPQIKVDHRLDYFLRERSYLDSGKKAPKGYVWPKEYSIRTTTSLGSVYDQIHAGTLSVHPKNNLAIQFQGEELNLMERIHTPVAIVSEPKIKKTRKTKSKVGSGKTTKAQNSTSQTTLASTSYEQMQTILSRLQEIESSISSLTDERNSLLKSLDDYRQNL